MRWNSWSFQGFTPRFPWILPGNSQRTEDPICVGSKLRMLNKHWRAFIVPSSFKTPSSQNFWITAWKKKIYIYIYIYIYITCMYVCILYILYIYILYIYYISIQCIWLKYTYQFSLVDFSLLSVNQMCKVNCFQRLLCKTARSLSCWNQSLNVFKEDQIFALQVHSVGISNMRMLREL